MDETRAREILKGCIRDDDRLFAPEAYLLVWLGDAHVALDGEFTADELEAIAWWMRHKQPKEQL